ncbi:MAG: hypothetical protein J7J86_10275, partial [Bacteroidales bacterium]|nr:hypothetical protein [Bacteroidales bacterium]
MKNKKTIIKRRIGVILTYLSLLIIDLVFEYCKIYQLTYVLGIIGIIAFVVFVTSFVTTYLKSGLWRFIHKPLKQLDEREIILTSNSLRYAYSIFTIFVLVLLLVFAITEIYVDIVLVVSLILFAHILP